MGVRDISTSAACAGAGVGATFAEHMTALAA